MYADVFWDLTCLNIHVSEARFARSRIQVTFFRYIWGSCPPPPLPKGGYATGPCLWAGRILYFHTTKNTLAPMPFHFFKDPLTSLYVNFIFKWNLDVQSLPDRCREEFGRVDVDDGERSRDAELPKHSHSRAPGAESCGRRRWLQFVIPKVRYNPK